MEKEKIRVRYESLSQEALSSEKLIQESKKAEALKSHEEASGKMTSGIVMSAFGLVFIWLLPASIPLLVIGIPKIVDSAKKRHKINDEYEEAVYRLEVIDDLLSLSRNDEEEAVNGEVIG